MSGPFILFLVGATAVGKTAVSLQLAEQFNAEIISCDALQIYRELSIATGKPSREEINRIPHHGVNIVCVKDPYDVAQFNQMASGAIKEILAKQKNVLVVGGSGMYMQVLLDGIFAAVKVPDEIRQNLMSQLQAMGLASLYEELCRVDPDAAQKIHPHDARRIIRALEVFQATGERISHLQKKRTGLWGGEIPIILLGLSRDRRELYERINARVLEMFAQGLIEEISQVPRGDFSMTSKSIIGVREALAYLNGEYNLIQCQELIQRNTRRFAKRQLTWFRKEARIQWVHIEKEEPITFTVNRIVEIVKSSLC